MVFTSLTLMCPCTEKRVNDEELKELQAHQGAMEKELDPLNQEIFHLEGSCNTKE
ncbi:hypothetical protein scyTo_0024074, partial [Scyliorhinus torazame]|nr:hypothetical protein [Scyliorhinus torazame]